MHCCLLVTVLLTELNCNGIHVWNGVHKLLCKGQFIRIIKCFPREFVSGSLLAEVDH